MTMTAARAHCERLCRCRASPYSRGDPSASTRGPRGHRGARRHARQALDQDHRQAAGHSPGRLDGRPHDARGRGHARQGAPPVRQGGLPGADHARDPLRAPRSASTRRSWASPARRWTGTGVKRRLGGDRLPVRAGLARREAARHRGRRCRRRRRDRHGDLARGLPRRRRRPRDGGDRARQGRVRRRPPEGDHRDRRARLVRPRAARLDARDGGGRRLHQDLHRQGGQRRHAGRGARDARGDPRLRATAPAASWA